MYLLNGDIMEIQEDLKGTAFENGYSILRDRGLAIVGMSPGNSYFKKVVIGNLLKYCAGRFSQVRIMIADKPAEHTYKAIGYTLQEAERKARLNGNTFQNHSLRSIDGILDSDITLVEWKKEIDTHEAYQIELEKVEKLYRDNREFRKEARDTTKAVLEGKLKPDMEMENAIDEGVNYLLKELAFLSASPKIFSVERVAYVYHESWRIYESFVDGRFDGQKRRDLGFVIIK